MDLHLSREHLDVSLDLDPVVENGAARPRVGVRTRRT
jgi:hypothetical protein